MKLISIPAAATVLLLLLTPAWAQSEKAENDLQRGVERYKAGDADGAIAAWSAHLKDHPKDAAVYHKRGNAKNSKGDGDGALADYTRAIELDPKNGAAYNSRGVLKRVKGDLDGALADYALALELDPKSAATYNNRGNAKRDQGDFEGAVADYTRALELDPKYAGAYHNRGDAYFLMRRWSDALADLRMRCELKPGGQEYAQFFIWLIGTRLGETKEADQEMSDYIVTRWQGAPRDWASRIGVFLLGKLSEADFLAAAAAPDPKTDRAQRCEAFFFAGMKRLFAGEKDAAAEHFRKCLATEQKGFVEYQLAQAELKALGGK